MNPPRFGGELAPIVGRSGHDRGSTLIAAVPSLQVSWTVPIPHPSDLPPLFKMAPRHPLASLVRWRSDAPERSTYRQGEKKIENPGGRLMEIARFERMQIGRSSWCHVAIGERFDCGHLKYKSRTCCDFDRVDSGPRDQRPVI